MIRDALICLLLLTGSTLMLLAAIGVLRFPDTLCRSHALTKATTFAGSLLLIALWIALGDDIAGLKILLVILFSMLTIPLSSQLVASLYYRLLHPLDQRDKEAAEKSPDA
ncbi:MAG: monovalent cation/H(+) antiporter subunit G [Verrucomicrobiaceae bacterium]|nr:monovalent cation/H(+) antiporter subunit G [Verrucomicrobiaceae bacterium]